MKLLGLVLVAVLLVACSETPPAKTAKAIDPDCPEVVFPDVKSIPADLMAAPEGKKPPGPQPEGCSNGVICGPIWTEATCLNRCVAQGTGCCMNCRCIDGGPSWCATPSTCYP